jgi:hypothetical protein
MQKLGFCPKTTDRKNICRVVAAPNAFGADRGKSVILIALRGRGGRPRLQLRFSIIVGRLCQTPLSGQSIAVSQKRPTISTLLTGADVAMDAVLVWDCLWVWA